MMSVATFFLVIFESEKPQTIEAGIRFIIQMHIGFVFLIAAFLISSVVTDEPLGFGSLQSYFSTQPVFPLFLLFFIGFGIKAGLNSLPHLVAPRSPGCTIACVRNHERRYD
jgi:formate hydrogenlyase subunit 3/multisubunit Na+/H+ antiporter MnhD subunit